MQFYTNVCAVQVDLNSCYENRIRAEKNVDFVSQKHDFQLQVQQ